MPYYFKEIPSEFAAQKPFQMYKSWRFSSIDMRKSIKLYDAEHINITQSTATFVIPPQQWIRDNDGRILSFNYQLMNGDTYFPVSESTNYNYFVSGNVYNTNQFTGYFDESKVSMVQESGALQVRYNGVTTLYTQSQNIFITSSTYRKNMWYSIWNMFYRTYDPTGSMGPYAPEFGYQMINSSSANSVYNDFVTGSLGPKALVFDISKRYYGEELKKQTFKISGYTIAAPAKLWTPDLLNKQGRVKLWFKADNLPGYTQGQSVNIWPGSDLNNIYAITSSTYTSRGYTMPLLAPTYVTSAYSYKNLPAVNFGCGSLNMDCAGLKIPANSSWMVSTASLFTAYKYHIADSSSADFRYAIFLGNTAQWAAGYGFGDFDGGISWVVNNQTSYLGGNSVFYPKSTHDRLGIIYRCSHLTHGGLWQDSASYASTGHGNDIAHANVINYSGPYDLWMGTPEFGGPFWTYSSLPAAIHEMILFSDELTDDEFQKVQGYLAWKWGDSAYRTIYGLAPSHPYYSAPPYFIDSEYNQLLNWDFLKSNLSTLQIHDDSNGNLYDSDNINYLTQSYGTSSVKLPLGNISYDKGLVIITNEGYRYVLSSSVADGYAFVRSTIPDYNAFGVTLQFMFTSSYTAYENEYICIAKANEFNWTDNRTAYSTDGMWKFSNISGSYGKFTFRPFVTGIGLYDDTNTLLAYAKMNFPVRIERDSDTVFIINFDT